MNNMQMSLGMQYAERISQELARAGAFAGKHDPQLQWDVNFHVQAARLQFESLAAELGYQVERIAPPLLVAAE